MATPCSSTNGPLPFVLVNMAISADGKIATANRQISSFGSPRDLAHLYELRASADAILSGARTINDEDVALDTGPARYRRLRLRRGLPPSPLRVVVTGSGRLNPNARIFRQTGAPLVILTCEQARPSHLQQLRARGAETGVFGRMELDFTAAFAWLAQTHGVKRLLVEGGGEVNSAIFRHGLVRELHLTVCPWVFGGRTSPTIADGPNPAQLTDATRCRLRSRKTVGDELFLVYDVLPTPGPTSTPTLSKPRRAR